MRSRENCINSTVDMRMQERSYMNHIMTIRHTKPSIETSQPETPLRFYFQQESWEKTREENIERSNLIKSRNQFSKVKCYKENNNKSVSFPEISSRSLQISSSTNRPSTSYSSSKIHNEPKTRLHNNYHVSDSQVFLTQSNVNSKPIKRSKTKLDIFLSNPPPNQWKQTQIPKNNESSNDNHIDDKIEPKRKKIERSPYRPAASRVLKMQKIVSNQFNKRYRRTEIAFKQNSNTNSGFNYETESECVANITDDNLNSENSILKSVSFVLHASNDENEKDAANNNSKIINKSRDESLEKFRSENDIDKKNQSENIERINEYDDKSSESTRNGDKLLADNSSLNDAKNSSENEPKKKRKKVIRKKVRKVKVIHQPQNDDLLDIDFSED